MTSRVFALVRSLVVATAFVTLWIWVAISIRQWDLRLPFTIPRWLAPFGLVVATLGGLLALTCVVTFGLAGRGTPAPFDPPREFVASGPYRFVRNPMYVGAIGVLIGSGLAVSSPSITLLGAAFFLVAHLFVIAYEEPALAAKFGASYDRYRESVPRWLITLGRRTSSRKSDAR